MGGGAERNLPIRQEGNRPLDRRYPSVAKMVAQQQFGLPSGEENHCERL